MLFELSEDGSLVEGVELPDGGRVRVAPLDGDIALPEGVTTRNADDRILATAFQISQAAGPEDDVQLITNDLNMLLKAQTLGMAVARYGEGVEGGFAKRYIIRPFQRYKVPIGILAVALAVFAAVLVIVFVADISNPRTVGSIPTEFRDLLTSQQQRALQALTTLQENPEDSDALLNMGNFYFEAMSSAQQTGDRVAVLEYARKGIKYYEEYLKLEPDALDARADLASLYFYSGQTDKAIQGVGKVLSQNPEHVNGNFNLGIFYWQGRRDLESAKDQMEKVIELTQNDSQQHGTLESARLILEQIKTEMAASGSTTSTEGVSQ
jgi:tetratricopeptide (TPR) repeat protein